jgi:hypothetical protein
MSDNEIKIKCFSLEKMVFDSTVVKVVKKGSGMTYVTKMLIMDDCMSNNSNAPELNAPELSVVKNLLIFR